MPLLRNSLLSLAALLALPAAAQEIQPGVQAALNLPMGDLGSAVDNNIGITLGGHLGIYYGNGHELRPRLDYTRYQGYTRFNTPEPFGIGLYVRNTVSAIGLGADYLYYTELRPQGFFLAMGLGCQWWTVDPGGAPSESKSALSFSAGAGYRLNRSVALEARFTTGQFQATNGQANALQLLASLRF